MKRHILISTIAMALAAGFTSCEDFLDKQPLDKVSTSTFWQTTKDADKDRKSTRLNSSHRT